METGILEVRTREVKTPFRWPGGKHYAFNGIAPFIEHIQHQEYREPFVGGGSVFFGKQSSRQSWINDIDPELINVYKTIKSPSKYKTLLSRVSKEVANPTRYKQIKKMDPKDSLERAFRYYYMNRTSYSGKMISPSWGYRDKRSIPPERWAEVLGPAHEKLKDTIITSWDFEKVIKTPSPFKDVLLYLDPPYFLPVKKKHYVHGFTEKEHLRLENSLRGTKFSFLLSYEDCGEVRELYKWAWIYKLAFPYRVGDSNSTNLKRKMGHEVIISNRRLKMPEHVKTL